MTLSYPLWYRRFSAETEDADSLETKSLARSVFLPHPLVVVDSGDRLADFCIPAQQKCTMRDTVDLHHGRNGLFFAIYACARHARSITRIYKA
jgi:hypothetical protein